jgi:aminoglycoside 2''-phosphotransferase
MEKSYPSYLDHIKEVFPFGITQVDIHDGGDDFLVFEINAEWMFRFPRNQTAQEALKKELKLLSRFAPLSPLPIPDYQYTGDGFAGYAKIHGRHLNDELFQELSRNTREMLAEQLGRFLSALNNFPLHEADEIGLGRGWDGAHRKNGAAFLEKVAPLLSPSTRNKATRCMEDLLTEQFEGKVIHGDFYLPDHVFLEDKQDQLSVIDFADANVYDPAHDFQSIVEIGGEGFFEFVMNYYDGEKDEGLMERLKLRLFARPLFVAGCIFANGLEDQYASRLATIEEIFSRD